MKTEKQIRDKIEEHENKINEILELHRAEWTDIHVMQIEGYLVGRKALLWVLSSKNLLEIDDFEKQAKYECLCFDSTKIF
jgi:hypothetical protein